MGKKKGGKAKKNYEPTPEEIQAMEEQKVRDELDNQLLDLVYTLKQEQDDFNEYQQQREKLNYFWIVEKKNLEDTQKMEKFLLFFMILFVMKCKILLIGKINQVLKQH